MSPTSYQAAPPRVIDTTRLAAVLQILRCPFVEQHGSGKQLLRLLANLVHFGVDPEALWSSEIVAFVAMQPTSGNVYDALAHAEYDSNGGQTIYVSYSRSTPARTLLQ